VFLFFLFQKFLLFHKNAIFVIQTSPACSLDGNQKKEFGQVQKFKRGTQLLETLDQTLVARRQDSAHFLWNKIIGKFIPQQSGCVDP